jgi:hypothetical protein
MICHSTISANKLLYIQTVGYKKELLLSATAQMNLRVMVMNDRSKDKKLYTAVRFIRSLGAGRINP